MDEFIEKWHKNLDKNEIGCLYKVTQYEDVILYTAVNEVSALHIPSEKHPKYINIEKNKVVEKDQVFAILNDKEISLPFSFKVIETKMMSMKYDMLIMRVK